MNRRLFTLGPAVSTLLCIVSGCAYVCTGQVSLYNPRPEFGFVSSVPLLGWACVGFAVLAIVLLRRRVSQLRAIYLRLMNGLCPACGYDVRATPEQCPECGAWLTVGDEF